MYGLNCSETMARGRCIAVMKEVGHTFPLTEKMSSSLNDVAILIAFVGLLCRNRSLNLVRVVSRYGSIIETRSSFKFQTPRNTYISRLDSVYLQVPKPQMLATLLPLSLPSSFPVGSRYRGPGRVLAAKLPGA